MTITQVKDRSDTLVIVWVKDMSEIGLIGQVWRGKDHHIGQRSVRDGSDTLVIVRVKDISEIGLIGQVWRGKDHHIGQRSVRDGSDTLVIVRVKDISEIGLIGQVWCGQDRYGGLAAPVPPPTLLFLPPQFPLVPRTIIQYNTFLYSEPKKIRSIVFFFVTNILIFNYICIIFITNI